LGFSENLARLQAEHYETNYQLAKEIHVHQSSIKNWRDGTKPHPINLKKVAEHYNCTVEDLLKKDNGE
jgi:DNA-binding XRE family transcriptional regulator